jgi:hypothetical protein
LVATVYPTACLGSSLQEILMGSDIFPGDTPSYQLCKTIFLSHPLGQKMAEAPLSMAQSQDRKISVPKGPEERLVEAFNRQWKALGCDRHIFNAARISRIYGISSVALMVGDTDPSLPVDYAKLADEDIAFNILDPLNTAGSLVLNQDPLSFSFLKPVQVAVGGKAIHQSRTVTVLNEEPIYIAYTTSAFGFVGRSVYQRALYPLKSFIQSMITDNLISLKAGVIVAKVASPSSAIDGIMDGLFGIKRDIIKEAVVGNVISIGTDEDIVSLNLTNIDASSRQARVNILDNIATAADMPATILNQETFAEGFGEGTEDAKRVAQYVDRIRVWMNPLYAFFDEIVMRKAWSPAFFAMIKRELPAEYGKMTYDQAFYEWKNSFVAEWPNLLREPDSELVKVDDVKLKALIALIQVLAPEVDPVNRANIINVALTNVNSMKLLFPEPFDLDLDALMEWSPTRDTADVEEGEKNSGAPPAFSGRDAMLALDEAIARLPSRNHSKIDRERSKTLGYPVETH